VPSLASERRIEKSPANYGGKRDGWPVRETAQAVVWRAERNSERNRLRKVLAGHMML
jgi:hypothetical protein